jgi:26S proteasome regulatory subunit N10
VRLGKALKKNNVALDIVCFGCMENLPKLEMLKEAVSSSDNSHLVSVPAGMGVLAD